MPTRQNYIRLAVINGQKKPRGMIFVPASLALFHKARIEPLILAIIRDGASVLTEGALEKLQAKFGGELEIFRSEASPNDFHISMLPGPGGPADKLKAALEGLGFPMMKILVDPESLEQVSQEEMRSSLRTG